MKLTFNFKYAIASVLLFLVEVLIATKLKNCFFVRAYLGDVIVVILLFTMVKTLFKVNNKSLIIGILLFSFLVEIAQSVHIAEKLGFRPGSLMYIVIGNSFSWLDLLCYFVGCLLLWILDEFKKL